MRGVVVSVMFGMIVVKVVWRLSVKLVYKLVIRLSVNVVVGCLDVLDAKWMNDRVCVVSQRCRTISLDANYLSKL